VTFFSFIIIFSNCFNVSQVGFYKYKRTLEIGVKGEELEKLITLSFSSMQL
jgi:hypothetical protein